MGAPSARQSETDVWTGSAMLVWRGLDANYQPLNDGAVYSPTTDSWTPIPSAGAPSPRLDAAIVWTGSQLVVWGGDINPDTYLTDGARYDLASNSWLPLPAAGAPSGRRLEAAVWTGTDLVIWGGLNATTALDDGARYDPATNTWQPLPGAGAPSPRLNPRAVWMGGEMYIFGGSPPTAGQALSPGARYDPALNQWTPLPTTGAPVNSGQALAANGALLVLNGSQAGGALYTPPTVGGEDFTLLAAPSGAVGLAWSGALGETGYLLLRAAANGTITTLPASGMLPPTATDYLDTPPASDGVDCYTLVAVGPGGVLGNSDVLCLLPDTRAGTGPPSLFAIQLDQTPTTMLGWAAPSGATGYELAALPQQAGATPRVSALPAAPTTAQDQTGGIPTCYVVLPLAGTQVMGNSDILCDVPGAASPTLTAHNAAAPQHATTVNLTTAKQRLTGAVKQVSAERTKATLRRVVTDRANVGKNRQ